MPKIVDHKARRAELVEASWKVIETEGLDGLTMRKVASAAGCTTGRITHYFPDREALVLAALRAANEAAKARTTALLAKDLPPRARLQKCVEEGLPLDKQRQREWKVWIAFWTAAASDPQLARENAIQTEAWVDALAALIADVAPGCDAGHEARILMGAINGIGLLTAISPTKQNRAGAVETLALHVEGLIARGGSD
ncbi:TetR/AcrR family transcriptional regulator [Pyruvatibacter mobilis]|uniref:TetR family transcriptional regulator n=1 Tax=Pyruvatibacter mobilis TaxID=1712261 RepID=A0A845QDX6_9HYPH|nr:TetR/AcrR family transcriptional regulator [Pyruvatibacter mobilis]NBG96647.1 TetR family transcriptional regulator [Pyruvatibacter mobilis]QJD74349.1 TetR family transcriptional regulator [Pyruvatibacter mobilis]GGD06183.1 hypothetical protein GCM10011587_07650 [Pyruvatibacter mobilis]